jgi:hypothetical protein
MDKAFYVFRVRDKYGVVAVGTEDKEAMISQLDADDEVLDFEMSELPPYPDKQYTTPLMAAGAEFYKGDE